MIAYKVVRDVSRWYHRAYLREYRSAFSDGNPVTYGVGLPTVPALKDGPLAAFSSLEDARAFHDFHIERLSRPKELKIFTAEVELDSLNQSLWCYTLDGYKWTHAQTLNIPLPNGTIFCKSITILEEVKQ